MVTDVNLPIVEQHAIHGLDGGLGGFGSLVVDIAIATRPTLLIGSELAR